MDLQLSLTAVERDCLAEILETAMKEARLEEHRTRTPLYREHVVKREAVIQGILSKLGVASER